MKSIKVSLLCLLLFAGLAGAAPALTNQPINCPNPDPRSPASCPDNWGLDLIDEDAGTVSQGNVLRDGNYRYALTGQGVRVYQFDTGIDVDNPAFAGRIGNSYYEPNPNQLNDCHAGSHGTRVAGIIGSAIYGVAKNVTLHPVKATIKSNCEVVAFAPLFKRALDWVESDVLQTQPDAATRRAVLNISVNVARAKLSPADFEALTNQVRRLITQDGIVVVVAAGNEKSDPRNYWPSNVDEAIVVGGLDPSARIWERDPVIDPIYNNICKDDPVTNPGGYRDCGSNRGDAVDIWAPAAYIHTVLGDNNNVAVAPILNSGTSYAAPVVTGTVALYLENHPGASPATVRNALVAEGTPLGDVDGNGTPDVLVHSIFSDQGGPCVVNDSFTTPTNTYFSFLASQLQANDCSSAHFLNTGQPQHGTVTIGGVGPTDVLYNYTPAAGFNGQDSFSYTVEDNQGRRTSATVNVQVGATSQVFANPDQLMVTAGQTLSFLDSQLLANDTPGAVFIRAENVQHGMLAPGGIGPDGRVYYYTPPAGFVGQDHFEYLISPDGFEPSTRGYVTVTVTDGPPTAAFTSACTGRACTFDASGSADDVQIVSYNWSFGDGTRGSGVSPAHTYAASGDYNVTLTVTDSHGQTAQALRTVVANLAPTASFKFQCAGLACSFDGSGSADDAGIAAYDWSFGDSAVGSGATSGHTFAATGVYVVTLTVTDTSGATATQSRKVSVNGDAPLAAERYFTLPPCRLFDSRNTTILTSGQLRSVQVTGNCGIPSTAKAVSFNLTVVSPTGVGYLTVYPGDKTTNPFPVSVLNFDTATSPRANNAVLQLATNNAGTINLLPSVAGSPAQVHVIVDVNGYFSTDSTPPAGVQGPFGYQALAPCRAVDTRIPSPSPVPVNTNQSFTLQGVCGVPAGAAAGMLDLAIVAPTAGGQATLFPAGATIPPVPSLNFNGGIGALANGARTRLGATTPDVTLNYYSPIAGSSTHAVIDVYGYFQSGAPLQYHPVTACRLVDTRLADSGAPALAAGETRSFQVQGNCGIPVGAKAAAINLVAVGPAGPGFLRAFAAGAATPVASALNFDVTQGTLANGLIVPLSTSANDLSIQDGFNSTHVVIDVYGYFQ